MPKNVFGWHYPAGVTDKDFDLPKYEPMSFSIELEPEEIQTDRGLQLCVLGAWVETDKYLEIQVCNADYEIRGNNYELLGRYPYKAGENPELDKKLDQAIKHHIKYNAEYADDSEDSDYYEED